MERVFAGNRYQERKETSQIPGVWFSEHILLYNPRELISASSIIPKCNISLFKTPIMGNMSFKNGKKTTKTAVTYI